MAGVPGSLVKDGAEGVYAGALADGRAFALKVDDGAARPRPLLAAAVLRRLGVEADVLAGFEVHDLLGGGRKVGEVRVPKHSCRRRVSGSVQAGIRIGAAERRGDTPSGTRPGRGRASTGERGQDGAACLGTQVEPVLGEHRRGDLGGVHGIS